MSCPELEPGASFTSPNGFMKCRCDEEGGLYFEPLKCKQAYKDGEILDAKPIGGTDDRCQAPFGWLPLSSEALCDTDLLPEGIVPDGYPRALSHREYKFI